VLVRTVILTTWVARVARLLVVTLTRMVIRAELTPVVQGRVRWAVLINLLVGRTVIPLVAAARAMTQALLVLVLVPTGALSLLGHRRFRWLSIL
jgi:hypothetical protein